ncbi:MAG TPA: BON domain-containing protein [Candidatus Angelobacter sp.]|nr:BON domain-containing protein [Candidatus Angelobacter sp.]
MRKSLHFVVIAAFALGCVFAVGQSAGESPRLSIAHDSEADQASQSRIDRQVRHELVMIPQLSIFDDLSYKVDGGTVTLLGEVRNPVIKSEAQAAVKHIEGVRQVSNEIEVLPVSFNDDRIRRQVARAIFNQPRLFEYAIQPVPPIHIIVRNGHVDLEGVVRDQGDKDVAGIRANGVPGVFSVQNDLQTENARQAQK